MFEKFSYNLETISIYFQGGVRRSVLIFAGICVVLLAPFYFIGQLAANFWSNSDLNSSKITLKSFVSPKVLVDKGYTIDRPQLVPLEGNETVLYTTINNKQNSRIGYSPFIYRVQILDENKAVIDEKIVQSYLLPGQIKYIIADPKNDSGKDLRITTEPTTQAVNFNPDGDVLSKRVNIEVRNPIVKETTDGKSLELTATLKNTDLVDLYNVDLLYIIRDNQDRVIGIGELKIQNIFSGEEKSFFVTYPKPLFRRATQLEIRPTVNYLESDSIRLR